MFTGIVEEIGVTSGINKTRTGISLAIKTNNIYADAKLGDSIAINGVCLSVINIKNNLLTFDVIHETLKLTGLGELRIGDSVNLERSLRVDSRVSGHFVSGHIDCKGRIEEILKTSQGTAFNISIPAKFLEFIVEKGSIALDGVSLTVADVSKESFKVFLIPHTLKVTTLGKKKKGDSVNIETDLLAKYIVKKTQKPNLENLLKKYEYF